MRGFGKLPHQTWLTSRHIEIWRIGYARISHGDVTDTELQVSRLIILSRDRADLPCYRWPNSSWTTGLCPLTTRRTRSSTTTCMRKPYLQAGRSRAHTAAMEQGRPLHLHSHLVTADCVAYNQCAQIPRLRWPDLLSASRTILGPIQSLALGLHTQRLQGSRIVMTITTSAGSAV